MSSSHMPGAYPSTQNAEDLREHSQKQFDAPNVAFNINSSVQHNACNSDHLSQGLQHLDLPLTAEDIRLCAATATYVSGMPLSALPKICVPSFNDFGMSAAKGRHCNGWFEPQSDRYNIISSQYAVFPSVYLKTPNQIILHPWMKPVLDTFGDNWPAKSILVHEMAHAMQAESFPEIFDKVHLLAERYIDLANTTPANFGEFLTMLRSKKKLSRDFLPISLLLEGHAVWVQTVAGESVFRKKTSFFHSLGYQLFNMQDIATSWIGSKFNYVAGYKLVCAVKSLQEELQKTPFSNYEGQIVTLAPDLQKDGILRLMFRNPHLVELVMPNLWTSWLPSSRGELKMQALRSLIIRMPGHSPLEFTEAEVVA